MPDPKDENLAPYWEDVRGQPVPIPDIQHFDAHPGELVIGTKNRVLVRIQPDGQLRYGEGYTPDEAAELFWTAMTLKRKGMEERLQHLGLLEQLLIRVGSADLRTELLRMRAAREDATEEDRFRAQMAMRNLEVLVHQMIELGRGLVARPEPVDPPPPPVVEPE